MKPHLSEKEYLKKGGNLCPFCGSDEITGGPVEIDGACALQEVSCLFCGAVWWDSFLLAGYRISRGPVGYDSQAGPWPAEEARQLRNTAIRLTSAHECFPERTREMRVNCGACCLRGYRPRGGARGWAEGLLPGEPNYAGWARAWVQMGWKVPLHLLRRELARTDNPEYVGALKRDLATWPQVDGIEKVQRELIKDLAS